MSLLLADLEPQLLRLVPGGERQGAEQVDALALAQGVWFLCPKCFQANGGRVGTHMVMCWFRERGVPDTATPGPARWAVSGTGLADLTLSPSIQLLGGCNWHGFVRGGVIEG